MNNIHGHHESNERRITQNVCSQCDIFDDIVLELLVAVVDVYRQPSQEVGQIKNRLSL